MTAGVIVCLLGFVVVAGLYWSKPWLTVADKPRAADFIVYLSGDANYRHPRALALYQEGLAPRLLLSGVPKDGWMYDWFLHHGVPESALFVQGKSRNTREDAEYSVQMLRQLHAHRVILVTSWFHSRRALACFRRAAPDLEFISLPTEKDLPTAHWPPSREVRSVLLEYVKLAGYWVWFGINPFPSRHSAP